MLPRLVIFGASGDLAARYLVPALAELWRGRYLDGGLRVLGIAREAWDAARFRAHISAHLPPGADAHGQRAFLDRFEYERADVTDREAVRRAVAAVEPPVIAYLALPPVLFAPAVEALEPLAGVAIERLVIEKPFGTDLESARALNATIHRCFPERAVFRIDHFLGHQTVQNILGLRFANRLFEPTWNAQHIERVEIVWDETLTARGRASYYDRSGALRDMLQNHLLQLMALIGMEPPHTLDERVFRNRKAELLSAVATPTPQDVRQHTIRARYTAGTIEGAGVPAYVDEEGVVPSRNTETFAQVTLAVNNWRWAGVPFTLRSGKGLGEARRAIRVHYRPVPFVPFDPRAPVTPNLLTMELEPDRVSILINLNGAGDRLVLEPGTLEHTLAGQELSPYARLLLDLLNGDSTLAIRADEVEESWRVMTPILHAWAAGDVPLHEYPAGSRGPTRAAA